MSMMPLTAALVISHRQLREQTHACIQNLPVRIALEESEPNDRETLLDRIERHRVDVVLVELGHLGLPLEEFVSRLRDTVSQPVVFVLHPEASPLHIMEALRAGAVEFLYAPLMPRLRDAFERLSAARSKSASAPASGLGRVYGFLSAKGGCGATTIACHAAVSTARQSKQPVLLADFDFEAGLVRFIMKSKGTYSVRDAINNLHRMDANFWKALVSKHSSHLDVLPAPEDLAAKEPPEMREVAHLMRFFRSVYPITVVDFGRHSSPAAMASLPELEALYLFATPDLATLEPAKDYVRAAAESGFERSRLKVVLNRMPERNAADPKGLENFIGIAPAATFVNDPMSLYEAWSEGRLLDSGSRLGRQFEALAASLTVRTATPAASVVAPSKSLFSRLFSQRTEGI